MHHLIKKTFENRGYTSQYIDDINFGAHPDLHNVSLMASHLNQAFLNQDEITIVPDFDMDGIMSGIEGYTGLSEMGFKVNLFIPDPSNGYGFDADTIDLLMQQYPNTKVILTCDVGITCLEGIARAKELGLTVLVTDHHIGNADNGADVTVDPMQPDDKYPHPQICGAYVLYQVMLKYADIYCNLDMHNNIRRLCLFAGMGTISDCMPLLYENRHIVRDAISICRLFYPECEGDEDMSFEEYLENPYYFDVGETDIYKQVFRNLRAMLWFLTSKGIISDVNDIDEDLFGFTLAPMFNSVKRMNGNINAAFGTFLFPTSYAMYQCMPYLFDLNNTRKKVVAEELDKLMNSPQPYAPHVFLSDAPAGILGLLATKLLESTGEPVLVLNPPSVNSNEYHGSGRTPEWYPFITRSAQFFSGFSAAGHEHAFGFSLPCQSIDDFVTSFDEDIDTVKSGLDAVEMKYDFVISTLGDGDTDIDVEDFDEYLHEIQDYAPFGPGFPRPNILLTFNEGNWNMIGSNKQHLKVTLKDGFQVLLWNQSNKISSDVTSFLLQSKPCRISGHLDYSVFNDQTSIVFIGNILDC